MTTFKYAAHKAENKVTPIYKYEGKLTRREEFEFRLKVKAAHARTFMVTGRHLLEGLATGKYTRR